MFCFVLLYHIVNSSNFPTTYNRFTRNGPHSHKMDYRILTVMLFWSYYIFCRLLWLNYWVTVFNWLSMISIPFQKDFDAWVFIFMVHRVLLFLQLIKRSAICAMEHKIKKKSHGTLPVVEKESFSLFFILFPFLHFSADNLLLLTNNSIWSFS